MDATLPATELVFRAIVFLLVFGTAVMAAIVLVGNVTAPRANLPFIRHIMSMDTTYRDKGMMWRAVGSPRLHWTAFVFIMLCEAWVAVLGFIGSVQLLRNFSMPAPDWESAKLFCYLSLLGALFIWFFIFQVIGAEWYGSWQSEKWNGIRDSVRINLITVAALILLRLS